VAGSRVVYRGGLALATSVAGKVTLLLPLEGDDARAVVRALTLEPGLRLRELSARTAG